MKSIITSAISTSILLLLTLCLQAQTYSAKSHKVTVSGTSTMHDWSSTATNVSVQGDFVINNGIIEKINNGSATIVTTSIKSQKNSGLMDSRTHETLNAKTSPNITYTQVRVVSVQPANGEAVVTLSGNLNIGGTAKPTEFVVRMKMLANGDVEVKGTKKILMSTYGIKPPSFMLGALKVGDEVSLDIYVLLHKN
ncbi:MAG TPA: hypothetical protein DCL43_06410 [Chitinophagaceae bacterium]|nr:hypothetical protein [Chitinophagaceae bacterium]